MPPSLLRSKFESALSEVVYGDLGYVVIYLSIGGYEGLFPRTYGVTEPTGSRTYGVTH
jgi:hypothetical protein